MSSPDAAKQQLGQGCSSASYNGICSHLNTTGCSQTVVNNTSININSSQPQPGERNNRSAMHQHRFNNLVLYSLSLYTFTVCLHHCSTQLHCYSKTVSTLRLMFCLQPCIDVILAWFEGNFQYVLVTNDLLIHTKDGGRSQPSAKLGPKAASLHAHAFNRWHQKVPAVEHCMTAPACFQPPTLPSNTQQSKFNDSQKRRCTVVPAMALP